MATTAKPPEKSTYRMTHAELLEAAECLGVDAAGLPIEALRAKVREVGEARFVHENRAAMDSSNAWVEKRGLPLARYRTF